MSLYGTYMAKALMDYLQIDKKLRPAIELLWGAGYETKYSCVGGHNGQGRGYILFEGAIDITKVIELLKQTDLRMIKGRVWEIQYHYFSELTFRGMGD